MRPSWCLLGCAHRAHVWGRCLPAPRAHHHHAPRSPPGAQTQQPLTHHTSPQMAML
jgi:hypothetical protein